MQIKFFGKIFGTILGGIFLGFLLSQLSGCASAPVGSAKAKNETQSAVSSRAPAQAADDSSGPAIAQALHPNEVYFQWPVDKARLSRGFLPKLRKPHWGIDLAAPKGTAILAAHDGVVIYAGREFKGFGKMVMIEGGKGWATLYAHFSKIICKEGQRVKRGDMIGEMGRSGHATGNHLHFEVRSENGPVNPLDYLPNGSAVAKLVEKHR